MCCQQFSRVRKWFVSSTMRYYCCTYCRRYRSPFRDSDPGVTHITDTPPPSPIRTGRVYICVLSLTQKPTWYSYVKDTWNLESVCGPCCTASQYDHARRGYIPGTRYRYVVLTAAVVPGVDNGVFRYILTAAFAFSVLSCEKHYFRPSYRES